MADEVVKKPLWKSKIALLALTLIGVFGGNYLFQFLGANITPEQIDAIAQSQPAVAEIIERLKNGESILSVIGSIIGVLILVFRAWFTNGTALTLK